MAYQIRKNTRIRDSTGSNTKTTGALVVDGGIASSENIILGGYLGITGTTNIVSVKVHGATNTYNFNLPLDSGSSGNILTSAGGGSSHMTWKTTTGTGDIVLASGPTFGAGGLTSTLGTTTLGVSTIGAITGTSATFSSTLGVTGLATFGVGGLTSTAGTTTLGTTTTTGIFSTINGAGFTTPMGAFNTTGTTTLFQIGRGLNSTGNTSQIFFIYNGNNDPTNSIGIGFYGGVGSSFSLSNSISTGAIFNCKLTSTTLNATGLTASQAVATDGSKNLISVANTGTGNNVLASSPTLVTPVLGAATGTSLSVSGQLTSTVSTGTAPLVVSSTTNVVNLNASSLSGATFASPGAIGSGTASTGAFTSLTTTGNVGIGTSSPNSALQFANVIANRRLVLWDVLNNDHNFHGFGVQAAIIRYQVVDTTCSHVFYAGVSSSNSNELFRVKGTGGFTSAADSSVTGTLTSTTLNSTGLTASQAVATDGSKNLISVANTGTGNNVLASSPTLVNPVLGAATATSLNATYGSTTRSISVGSNGTTTIGNISISGNGQARYHLYNNGAVCEWTMGQKTISDHSFTISSFIASETDRFSISPTGVVNITGLTASQAVATDGSKNLISVANTGSGNNVLATSPSLSSSLIINQSASGVTYPLQIINSDTTAGNINIFTVGQQAGSLGNANSATINFGYTGSNNAANFAQFGLGGSGKPSISFTNNGTVSLVNCTLPVASGGTGTTTSTGSGNNVLSASPTLTSSVTTTPSLTLNNTAGGPNLILDSFAPNGTGSSAGYSRFGVNSTAGNFLQTSFNYTSSSSGLNNAQLFVITGGSSAFQITNNSTAPFTFTNPSGPVAFGAGGLTSTGNISGTGNISASNYTVGGSVQATGALAVSTQGAVLSWNRTHTTNGATFLMNQKGGGSGGIYFGTVTTGNVFTEQMSISDGGTITLAGQLNGQNAAFANLSLSNPLPVSSGGSGSNISTGSGANVLAISPTFTQSIGVNSNSNPVISIISTSGTIDFGQATGTGAYSTSSTTGDLVIRSGARVHIQSGTAAAAITINTSNQVGIGISNPNRALYVGGVNSSLVIGTNAESETAGLYLANHSTSDRTVYKTAILAPGFNNFYRPTGMYFCINNIGDGTNVSISDSRLTILRTGEVGIGTNAPGAPLTVLITTTVSVTGGYFFASSTASLTAWSTSNQPISIFSIGAILTQTNFLASSDSRIKDITNEQINLNHIDNINPVIYTYKDRIKNPSKNIGFIAQNVKEYCPEAVKIHKGIIPDIMKVVDVIEKNSDLITIKNEWGFVKNAVIKIMVDENDIKGEEVKIIYADNNIIKFNNLKVKDTVFIYGRQVDDFHELNYDYVFALGFAGIKEARKEIKELKEQMKVLQELVAKLI
jgi:hypothetical protein